MNVAPAMSSQLASLEALTSACVQLASIEGLADVLELQSKAEAVATYFKIADKGSEAHALAWGLVQVSSRRIGELTRELPKAKPGPKAKPETADEISPVDEQISKGDQVAALKLSRRRVAECEKLAALDEQEFRARLDAGRAQVLNGERPSPVHAASSAIDYDGDESSTPAEYVEPAREALGGRINLDPASNAYAANVIRADKHYTKEDSGLAVEWKCDALWLNAPYSGKLVQQFADKLIAELAAGHIGASVSLWNASTETAWFQALLGACDAVCFPSKRIQFEYRGEPIPGSNRYAQAFFYNGPKFKAFVRSFSPVGQVLVSLNKRPRS